MARFMRLLKNNKKLYYLLGGILALAVLYLILAIHIPAIKMRIFVFALWLFGEIYLWISILNSFRNIWKKRVPFFTLLVLYWIPACIVGIAMCALAVKGMQQLNKTLYLTVMGVCVIQYLIKFLLFSFVFLYDIIIAFIKSLKCFISFLTQRRKNFSQSAQRITKPFEKGRRILLCILLGVYIISFMLMIYGTIWGADDFQIREVNIEQNAVSGKKFAENENLKIVLLSDLHLAAWRNHKSMEKAVKMANDQQPDIIFITGDFVQSVSDEMVKYLPILSQMKARYGIYTVLGNHDYGRYARFKTDDDRKADVQKLIDYQTSIGWKVLNNESVKLYQDSIPLGVTIAGVEYYSPKKMFINEGDMVKTFQDVDSTDYVILLSHDPQAWYDVINKNLPANLTLSGHTHGMQLGFYFPNFKWSPASILYKQWGGLYEKQGKLLYINVGLGSVGFPARVGMPPEITVIRLKRE